MAELKYKIIGIIGIARSGKNTVAGHISKKYNFLSLDFSDNAFEPLLKERGILPLKENKGKFSVQIRKEKGMNILAKILWEKIKQNKNENIVISGFRCIEEINYLKSKAKKIDFIRINADEKIILKYGSMKEILRNERDLKNLGFEKVLTYPAFQVQNTGTKKELFNQIDKIISELNSTQ